MKGQPLTEKSYELIKQMLIQGYSVKKVVQMLPDAIKVSPNVVYRVDKAATYDEYRGIKKEPEPKIVPVMSKAQSADIVEAINKTNVLLESLFQMVKELCDSLS